METESLRTLRLGKESFEAKGRHGLHNAVEFCGPLTVTDPAKFQETFARGVGSAKGFGFGMLAVVPFR